MEKVTTMKLHYLMPFYSTPCQLGAVFNSFLARKTLSCVAKDSE